MSNSTFISLTPSSINLSMSLKESGMKCCVRRRTNADKSVSFQGSNNEEVLIPGDTPLRGSLVNNQFILVPYKAIRKEKMVVQGSIAGYWRELVDKHGQTVVSIISACEGINFGEMYERGKSLQVSHVHVLNNKFNQLEAEEEAIRLVDGIIAEMAQVLIVTNKVPLSLSFTDDLEYKTEDISQEIFNKFLICAKESAGLGKKKIAILGQKLDALGARDGIVKDQDSTKTPRGLVQITAQEASQLLVLASTIVELCKQKLPGVPVGFALAEHWTELFVEKEKEEEEMVFILET